MYLQGQGNQRGYAMAALLVSIGVMTVLMSVAMPVWRHEAQREKEAELIFRGEQYARAVNLYQRKMGPGNFPPTVDILVQQRFLRKKYQDPITKSDFQIIPMGGGGPAMPGQQQQPGGGRGRGRGATSGPSQPPSLMPQPPSGGFGRQGQGQEQGSGVVGGGPFGGGGQRGGGIMGVVSKSKETSIRIYRGGTHYNEWAFLFSNVSNRPGVPGGQGAPGMPDAGRGGRGGRRGNPGGLSAPGPGGPGGFGRPGGGRGGGRDGRPSGSGPGRGIGDR
ncbi:MAG: type II secretion system GspH family protein [Acidobacteriota bacterium]|nr:type II secretion system GspH family protein [Acidobacteriota bacterium]